MPPVADSYTFVLPFSASVKALMVLGVIKSSASRNIDILTARHLKPPIPRVTSAAIQPRHPCDAIPKRLNHRETVIRRAVIHHDDLDGLVGLLQAQLDGLGDPGRGVVAGDDDGNERICGRIMQSYIA